MNSNKPLKTKTPLKAKTGLKANAKPRRQAKPAISLLKRKADKLFAQYVRYRDCELMEGSWQGRCITCDTLLPINKLQAGHFMSRRHLSTRWEEENVNIQCAACNLWGAGEQYKYSVALDLKYGPDTAAKLALQSKTLTKIIREDLEGIIHDATESIIFYQQQEYSYEP